MEGELDMYIYHVTRKEFQGFVVSSNPDRLAGADWIAWLGDPVEDEAKPFKKVNVPYWGKNCNSTKLVSLMATEHLKQA